MGGPQNVPKHEADPAPNFVIIGEAGRSIFDFPQPEKIRALNPIEPKSTRVQEPQALPPFRKPKQILAKTRGKTN
jgi:hypothetical protein